MAFDTPYSVHLTCMPHPQNLERRYLTDFCLRRDEGQPVVVEAVRNVDTGEYRCREPGEAKKSRSFWDKLLGRH